METKKMSQPGAEPESTAVPAVEETTPAAAEPEITDSQAAAEPGAEPTEQPKDPDGIDETPAVEPESKLAEQMKQLSDDFKELKERNEKNENRIGFLQRKNENLERRFLQEPAEGDPKTPVQEEFETFEDYQVALNKYNTDKALLDNQRKQAKAYQQSDLQVFIEETKAAGRKKFSDFDQVNNDNVPITAPMIGIMQGMDNPEAIVYYLGKNMGEAVTISKMSPIQAARALTRIETKVAAEISKNPAGNPDGNTSAKNSAPKKASNAPAPIKPTKSANIIKKAPEDMTQEEYEQWRDKGGGK